MEYNILSYWRTLQNLPPNHEDRPKPRVCRLMVNMFEKWRNRQPFPPFDSLGHIRDHADVYGLDQSTVMSESLIVRRSLAIKYTLDMAAGDWGKRLGLFELNPDELIIGNMPPYSVGQGKETMGYFKDAGDNEDEALQFEARFLNGWSNFGHICPDHQLVVEQGLDAIVADCIEKRKLSEDDEQKAFYQSVITALEGVMLFAEHYSNAALEQAYIHERILDEKPEHPQRKIFKSRITSMKDAANRLKRIPAKPCESFLDAVQCVYIMNCALHWTGELTSLGRLDQIFQPFLDSSAIPLHEAQEIIDCFWVKLSQRVTLDQSHISDHFSQADGALLGVGGASNFDQGALANQWMQQVTIGGVLANDEVKTTDACNDVTRLCLHASRRLPLNCPTLDLRVHSKTPDDVLELAARSLLSGGAHPVLLNDDKLVPALKESNSCVELKSARNYACDGCYETIFPGETEFTFIYVPGVDVLEKALNSGAGFGASGSTFLRGMKSSYRTKPVEGITDFEDLYGLVEDHIWLNTNRQISGFLNSYGCKGDVCPSPLLSSVIKGCIDKGRDFYNGGARYHMLAPLMTGISTVADSLHVINKLVFEEKKMSLEELVSCLRSDWGGREVVIGLQLTSERISELRSLCMEQTKFGHGIKDVDQYAWRIADSFVDAVENAMKHPMHQFAIKKLGQKFGDPFNLVITPGVGTFEQYNFGGSFAGATPDGRKAGAPIASDLSSSPYPQDIDNSDNPDHETPLLEAFKSWNSSSFNRFSDGAPSDFNILENVNEKELTALLHAFSKGEGSNIMTITTANPDTLVRAENDPENYDLVRVRMGGWTEFYKVLFQSHKAQHQRRPVYSI